MIRAGLALFLGLAAVAVAPRVEAMRVAHRSPDVDGLLRAAELDARNAKVQARLARLYRDGPGGRDADAALRRFERAVELNPHAWNFRVELAELYERAGRREAAAEQLREARRRDPIGPRTAYALGAFHLRAGEIELAMPLLLESMWTRPRFLRAGVPLLLEAGVPADTLVDTAPADRRSRLRLLRQLVRSADAGDDAGLSAMARIWRELRGAAEPPTAAEAAFFLEHLAATGATELAAEVRRDLARAVAPR